MYVYVCMYIVHMYICIICRDGIGLVGWMVIIVHKYSKSTFSANKDAVGCTSLLYAFSQNKRRIVLGIRAFCVPVFLFVRFYISHCNCFCRREKDALQDSLDESFILSWCWWGGRHWRIFKRNCGWAFWQFCDKISKTGFLCPSNRVITRKKPPCP